MATFLWIFCRCATSVESRNPPARILNSALRVTFTLDRRQMRSGIYSAFSFPFHKQVLILHSFRTTVPQFSVAIDLGIHAKCSQCKRELH